MDVFSPRHCERTSSLTSQTVIGPGNVISGNLHGVRISGPDASAKGVVVRDNLIGTDITGTLDLGNAQRGRSDRKRHRRRDPGRCAREPRSSRATTKASSSQERRQPATWSKAT